jgi:hypothetical protein
MDIVPQTRSEVVKGLDNFGLIHLLLEDLERVPRGIYQPTARNKEGLYLAVLEEAYSTIRRTEATLDLDTLAPEQALRTLIGSPSTITKSIPSSCGWQ